MTVTRQRRLPIGPLLERAGPVISLSKYATEPYMAPYAALAVRCELNPKVVHRALQEGVTVTTAEKWAGRLGYHPVEIWGDAYYADIPAVERFGPEPEWEPGNTFCARPWSYAVPDHDCAVDGCYCGRETNTKEVAA